MIALFDTSTPGTALRPAGNCLDGKDRTIDINDLRFSWEISSAPVLDIANLQVDKGQRVFIEGPSGSGKSTLLGLLADTVIPQAGRVNVLY
jgi:putative ABC transport system ATP-binding protein